MNLDPKIPIQAWLSYRCKDAFAQTQRDELKDICEAQGIRLVYDESDAQEGDHLIKFMEDLTSARCVFIFLSPDYFESSYTLFELVSIYERSDLDQRFILPVRLTENMVTYVWTQARDFWDQNEDKRNELARLLGVGNSDVEHEQLWHRINNAWHKLIFPLLDELHSSLESERSQTLLNEQAAKAQESVQQVIGESEKKLLQKVRSECTQILQSKHIPLSSLVQNLGLDTHVADDVVAHMLSELDTGRILDILLKVSLQRERELANQKATWEQYLQSVEQFCGWLLIRSVDKVWWFQQELIMAKNLEAGIASEFAVDSDSYVEVIISRNLLQRAQFRLDQYGDIVPDSEYHDVLLFDAVSHGASDIELLTPVFKDLRRSPAAPQSVSQLLKGISRTVKASAGSRDGKPIYYLVSRDYFDLLRATAWYKEMSQSLSGYLYFVCCRLPEKNYESNPCQGDSEIILEKVASLLRLRNPKEH